MRKPLGTSAAQAAALVSLVVLLALAGCSGPDGGAGPTESSTASATSSDPAPTGNASRAPDPAGSGSANGTAPDAGALGPTLTLTECANFGGVFPVPMDAARAALPPGFEPVATPSDPAGGATLYVLGLRCAGSSVDGADAGPADLAYAELAVVPPPALALDGLADCTVPLLFTSGNAAVAAALAAYRLGLAGPGEVEWTEPAGLGDTVVAAAIGDAAATLRGAAAPGPAAPLGSGRFALYGVQGGEARTAVVGAAAGGEAVDAAVALEAAGLGLLEEARPVVRGFSVRGFGLTFTPVALPSSPGGAPAGAG